MLATAKQMISFRFFYEIIKDKSKGIQTSKLGKITANHTLDADPKWSGTNNQYEQGKPHRPSQLV